MIEEKKLVLPNMAIINALAKNIAHIEKENENIFSIGTGFDHAPTVHIQSQLFFELFSLDEISVRKGDLEETSDIYFYSAMADGVRYEANSHVNYFEITKKSVG